MTLVVPMQCAVVPTPLISQELLSEVDGYLRGLGWQMVSWGTDWVCAVAPPDHPPFAASNQMARSAFVVGLEHVEQARMILRAAEHHGFTYAVEVGPLNDGRIAYAFVGPPGLRPPELEEREPAEEENQSHASQAS